MQEEFKLKIKRTAKKLAAVGTGALVAGMTLTGAAFAADLSGLPAPIVSSGAFDAYVVVGTNAATIDVAGAIELSTAFGQLATTTTGAEGQATLEVEVFTGETLAAMNVDNTVAEPLYHSDANWEGTTYTAANSNLNILNDVVFSGTDNEAYNATISLKVDDDFVEITKENLALRINASTDSDNVIEITLTTNRTTTAKFLEGDSINWFGTLFEIVDLTTDGNVTLGNTETVTAYKDESFTIGGQTFTLKQVADATVVILDANSDIQYINSTYSTIGTIQLKTTGIQNVPGYEKVTFETIESSFTFAVGDVFPVNSGADGFIVDSMTVNITDPNIDSAIVLRNNESYTLTSKTDKASIIAGLEFSYTDNTGNANTLKTTLADGGTGQINISETNGVTITFDPIDDPINTELDIVGDIASLPGALFKTYNAGTEQLTTVTDLTNTMSVNITSSSDALYIVDGGTSYFEMKMLGVGNESITWYYPDVNTSISRPTSWVQLGYNINWTTPSGVVVDTALNTTRVAAVRIDIDASTYYGRNDVSWAAAKFSDYGAKISWSGSSVTVTEPNGNSLTALIGFKTNDDAYFNEKASLKYNSVTLTATGNTTSGTYKYQTTDYDSLIGFWSNLGSVAGRYTINGTFIDQTIAMVISQKELSVGIGAVAPQTKTLDTDETTSTYANSHVFGNTTVTLVSGAGSSVTVNKVTPGFAKLDADITTTTLAKPVVLVGGSSVNTLVKNLIDNGLMSFTDLIAQGEGHAQIDLVENAFNSQTALVIAGYTGTDTLMAARAVTGAMLNGQPFGFTTHNVTSLLLNTGVTAVNDVAVVS
ncbi:MAG: S-layer protein [Nanoarchaeota archaeon]|nr:S-layer protein [Nanoarchaeota archaeon]